MRGVEGASGSASESADAEAEGGREVQREGVAGRGVSIAAGGGRRAEESSFAGGAGGGGAGAGAGITFALTGRLFARTSVSIAWEWMESVSCRECSDLVKQLTFPGLLSSKPLRPPSFSCKYRTSTSTLSLASSLLKSMRMYSSPSFESRALKTCDMIEKTVSACKNLDRTL